AATGRRRPRGRGWLSRPASAARQMLADRLDQEVALERLRQVIDASRFARARLILAARVRGQREHRDMLERRIRLQPARRLPPVEPRERQIHQDEIRDLARSALEPVLAVFRFEELEQVEEIPAHDVAVLWRVLDVEDPRQARALDDPPRDEDL